MADNKAKYGFRFHSTRSGSSQPNVRACPVATSYDSGNSTNINAGDVVKLLDDGTVALAAAGDTNLFGVVAGIQQYWDGSKMVVNTYLPNITAYGTVYERESRILVIPFNDAIFEVDCDDAVTATTYAGYRTLVNLNCDLSVSANATTGKANYRLDISDNKTGSAQFRIWDISPTAQNVDFSGNYVKLLVVANETGTSLAGYDSGASGL
jgi:hypothetical protein